MGSPPAPKHFKKVVWVDWVCVRVCVAEVFWESWTGGICEVGRLIFKGNKFVWKKEMKVFFFFLSSNSTHLMFLLALNPQKNIHEGSKEEKMKERKWL